MGNSLSCSVNATCDRCGRSKVGEATDIPVNGPGHFFDKQVETVATSTKEGRENALQQVDRQVALAEKTRREEGMQCASHVDCEGKFGTNQELWEDTTSGSWFCLQCWRSSKGPNSELGIIHKGMLKKKSASSLENWQERQCVLTAMQFMYFKGKNTIPRAIIKITEIISCKVRSLMQGKQVFYSGFVICTKERDFVWQGSSLEEAEKWVKAICFAAETKFLETDERSPYAPVGVPMEGLLSKRVPSVTRQSWQARRCVLTESEFQYFKTTSSGAKKGTKPKGSILVSDIEEACQHDIWSGKKLDPRGLKIIVVSAISRRVFLWRAESKEESERWAESINGMMSQYSGAARRENIAGHTWDDDEDEDEDDDCGGNAACGVKATADEEQEMPLQCTSGAACKCKGTSPELLEDAHGSWFCLECWSDGSKSEPQIICQGMLHKKAASSDIWQERRCVLTAMHFTYFKGKSKVPQSTIRISNVLFCKKRNLVAGKQALKNGFVISTDDRDFVLRGSSEEDAERWVKAICFAANKSLEAARNSLPPATQWSLPLEGVLLKRVPALTRKAWQLRRCVLTQKEFQYFKPGKIGKGAKPRGSIFISDIKEASQHDIWSGKKLDPRGFKISVVSGREFVWRAESKDDVTRWLLSINSVMSQVAQQEKGARHTWDEDEEDREDLIFDEE